jgi:hypothetical protein
VRVTINTTAIARQLTDQLETMGWETFGRCGAATSTAPMVMMLVVVVAVVQQQNLNFVRG